MKLIANPAHLLQSAIICLILNLFTVSANAVQSNPTTVTATVEPELIVEGIIAPNYTFEEIDPASPFDPTPEQTITVTPFYVYTNDTNASISITLSTPNGQSDASNTWMNAVDDPSNEDTVPYRIVYYPCSDTQPSVDLSQNNIDPPTAGISCANHTCTIANTYANPDACNLYGGHLDIIREHLNEKPQKGTYSGSMTLTESML